MIDETATVREIAGRYPQSLKVFDRYGIDYCCGGLTPLADAAAGQKVALGKLAAELEEAISRPLQEDEQQRDWSTASLRELSEHIVAKHHAYLAAELPALESVLATVARVHGPAHGDVLKPLQDKFQSLKAEIEDHVAKEEQSLFPALKQLEERAAAKAGSGSRDSELRDMLDNTMTEHEQVGAVLHGMRECTLDYNLPPDACPTFARLYIGLNALEKDVHQHIHLENNVLFPRAEKAVGREARA